MNESTSTTSDTSTTALRESSGPNYVHVSQAAVLLRRSEAKVRELIESGDLEHVVVNDRTYIDLKTIVSYLEPEGDDEDEEYRERSDSEFLQSITRLPELEDILKRRCNAVMNWRRLRGEDGIDERIEAVRNVLDELERRMVTGRVPATA